MRLQRLSLFAGIALLLPGCSDTSDDPEDNITTAGIDSSDPSDPAPADPEPEDPGVFLEGIDGEFQTAANEFSVPVEILQAMGYTETQWQMIVGEQEFDGWAPAMGAMGLRGEMLTRGAELLGVDEDDVVNDRATNIRAAAAILGALADERQIDRSDLGAWAPAVAELAGVADHDAAINYIHNDVFGLIKNGLVVTDLDGNVISEIDSVPDVSPDYDLPGGPVLATNPDYAGAIYRNSPNQGARPSGATGKVRMVIIHSCEGAYSGCWGWLVNTQSGVSAHYVVKEDGSEISQLVKESARAFHIAAKYNPSLNGGKEPDLLNVTGNNFTVGIEHAGFANQNSWHANLIDQSAKLVCDITKRNSIARDKYHIVAHGQLQPANRIDPGPNWPWASYLSKIQAQCGDGTPVDPQPSNDPAEIIIDSNQGLNNATYAKVTASANWTATAASPGYYGSNYLFANTEGISDAANFEFFLNTAGNRKIEIWYTSGTNRSATTPVIAFNANGANLGTVNVNQQSGGGAWKVVGTFPFTAGWNKISVSRWTGAGYVVIADAIRVTK